MFSYAGKKYTTFWVYVFSQLVGPTQLWVGRSTHPKQSILPPKWGLMAVAVRNIKNTKVNTNFSE